MIGQQPESPSKSSVPSEALEKYFQSIREPFRETCDGMAKDDKGVSGTLVVLFIACLFPIIPAISWSSCRRYWSTHGVPHLAAQFHLTSFWVWWVGMFIITIGLLSLGIKFSGASAQEKKRWLSPPQMRFAYCYGVVDEIRKYKTNQMDRHIDTASEYLRKSVNATDMPMFSFPGSPWRPYPEPHTRRVVHESLPKWYRLRPETEAILEAFRTVRPRLRDRIKDRKDLSIVESAMTHLSTYLYLEIAELSDSSSDKRFEEGIQSLLIFAEQIKSLPVYRSERLKPTPKEKVSQKLVKFGNVVTAPFSHENVIVAFGCWLVLLFILFDGSLVLAIRHFMIDVDSTLVTALISGPILGAVTAVTIPRIGKKKT